MTPLIFDTVSRFLQPLLLLFSIYLLLSGHHDPGGGFAGGLVGASAFVLHATARGPASARKALRLQPSTLIGSGLLVAVASGTLGLLQGRPFLSSAWVATEISWLGKVEVGTPLLFDAGIYLVVMGVALTVVFELAEE
jgi:multicomponent Na+:H+ antiporter subunit B